MARLAGTHGTSIVRSPSCARRSNARGFLVVAAVTHSLQRAPSARTTLNRTRCAHSPRGGEPGGKTARFWRPASIPCTWTMAPAVGGPAPRSPHLPAAHGGARGAVASRLRAQPLQISRRPPPHRGGGGVGSRRDGRTATAASHSSAGRRLRMCRQPTDGHVSWSEAVLSAIFSLLKKSQGSFKVFDAQERKWPFQRVVFYQCEEM